MQQLFDTHGASRVHDALFLGQNDADIGMVAHGIARHLFVALLENVERQGGSGKDHHAQGKQRNEARGHANIMARTWLE